MVKEQLVSIKVKVSDRKKLKKWAVIRDMKLHEIISLLVNKK